MGFGFIITFISFLAIIFLFFLAVFFTLDYYLDLSDQEILNSDLNYSNCYQGNITFSYYNISTKSVTQTTSDIKIYSKECIDSLI